MLKNISHCKTLHSKRVRVRKRDRQTYRQTVCTWP